MRSNREKEDIVEVVSRYLTLTKKGYNERPYYLALCPFHTDTSPSFVVFPNIQRYVCYSCDADGGDVVDFISKIKGISREEALSEATYVITPVNALKKKLNYKAIIDAGTSLSLFNHRILSMHRHIGVTDSREKTQSIVRYIKEKKLTLANRVLSEEGF